MDIVKHIEISLMEDGELSIDGEVRPAGNIEIREFENGEWVGGSYATYDNLVEKVKEALEDYEHLKEEAEEQQRRDEKNELYGPRKQYQLDLVS
jgi:hypothetical protein